MNNRLRVLLGRGGTNFLPDATITFSDGAVGTPATDLALTVGAGAVVNDQQIPLTGGDDGAVPDATALRGTRAAKTGMYALEDVDLFNILSIPSAADLAANDMRAVYAEAEVYCDERRSFLIVDIPASVNDLDEMQTWLSQNEGTLRDTNAAVYFPRPRIADPLNQNRLRSVGASGTMAGLYAQTDATRGVWKAPAGTDARLRNVQELDYILTDRQTARSTRWV